MTTDIRVLSRERFARMKDADSLAPKGNRHEKRMLADAAGRHAKLLEASRIKVVGKKDAVSTEDKKQMGGLREEIAKADAPAGFTGTAAGLLIPIALAFALANVKCGSATTDDQDMDTTEDDAVTEVEPDETPEADADVSEDTVPDEVEQTDEGVGPDADADVEAEDEGSEIEAADADVEEDGGEEDVIDVPDETPVCDPIIHDEMGAPEPSGSLCGIAKEKVVTVRITDYPEGCGIPRATSLESILFRVLGPLPADLMCAVGEETEGLNSGVFLIVSLSPTELQMGGKIASEVNMPVGGTLNGGLYKLRSRDVHGLGVDTWLLDSTDRVLDYGFRVPPPIGTIEIDAVTAAMAWNLVFSTSASLGIIRLPLEIATDGRGIYYNGIGDEGWFTAFFGIDGAGADETWRFDRDHTK